ncbi:DMT family transporter [Polymorphobacter fuscus]|uniref:EamA family transporter n=1 Tax=Sandarakinorhabdus fusca TaxID=1439888 RepID=A0A7C9KWV5_9SPHN|nr:DMT family transporter [Polymorphobacter fuscus]KAB7646127.1 DMT family transporter [Polymorphobacter fuscus]MQT17325.1 EamA family transporter [Polymorphobacter fuscus]NJC10142.1 O-acetylserine/cysteine efflux transporter [Polymorphobacter fuscus]
MKREHLALILFIDLIWAFNIVPVKLAVEAAGPLTAVLLRYAIVLVVTLPWLRWLPGRMLWVLITGFVAGALFMGLGSLSFALAQNVSALAIAGQLGVPFSLILAVLIYKERIRWPRITAVALCFAGVAVMGFDPAIADESIALWLTVAAALCWAMGNLLFRKLAGVPVLTIHAWLAAVSVPILAGAAAIFEPQRLGNIASLSWLTWGCLLFSGLLSSLLGHGGMSWLFQRYPVATVSPLTLPTPLLSVIIAVIVFNTPITTQMLIGGALTLIGVAIITLRTAKARDDNAAPSPIEREDAA